MKSLFTSKKLALILGPCAFALIYWGIPIEGLSDEGRAILACTVWIATWWVSEAIPIAVTSLLPIVLFPLMGAVSIQEATSGYSHPYIFIFLGGFILAIAIEKWNLHRRIALMILAVVGSKKSRIILGFMIATAFLSMWISNTATAAMMLPIGIAMVAQMTGSDAPEDPFGKALMLAIGYSASIGGFATLIGTPPNLILASMVNQTYGVEITFIQWMKFAFPFSVFLLVLSWIYLTQIAFKFRRQKLPNGNEDLRKQRIALGSISMQEKRVLVVFVLTAVAWISRSYLLQPLLPALDDSIIAIAAAVTLFILPSGSNGALLKWEDTRDLPWGVILLFGGGISLANGFEISGLAQWIGDQFNSLQDVSLFLLLLIIIASVNFLTEITSNTAITALLLPILASLAVVADVHPYLLLTAAAMAASCAFMLPVASPPNAIVFGSGKLKITDMIRAGFMLNVVSIVLLTLLVYFMLPWVWEFTAIPYPF